MTVKSDTVADALIHNVMPRKSLKIDEYTAIYVFLIFKAYYARLRNERSRTASENEFSFQNY